MNLQKTALSIKDDTIIKAVQATHCQGDVRYGTFRGFRRSCMSLVSVSWALFKFDLDFTLSKRNLLFKFSGKFRCLGIEEFLMENSSVNMEFLENKIR